MKQQTTSDAFLSSALREFRRLKSYADTALARVDDKSFFRRLDEQSNSIAVLVKHLAGNMRSRWSDFLSSDGEKPYRDRDAEFEIAAEDTREKLLSDWEASWSILFATLEALCAEDLARIITIRGEEHLVTEAISRQLPHYGFHLGQVVLLCKHFSKNHWESLTIARGQSEDFNKNPQKFLK